MALLGRLRLVEDHGLFAALGPSAVARPLVERKAATIVPIDLRQARVAATLPAEMPSGCTGTWHGVLPKGGLSL